LQKKGKKERKVKLRRDFLRRKHQGITSLRARPSWSRGNAREREVKGGEVVEAI